VPDFAKDAAAYVDGLLGLLDEYPAQMMLPAHDGSIQALRTRRAQIERRIALPLASESALDIAVSKARTLALAEALGIAVPRSVPVSDIGDVPAAMEEVGVPAVVKPDQSWTERAGMGTRLSSEAVTTVDRAKQALEGVFAAGGRALIQQWLPGSREAVSLFYAHGRIWARMAQVSHREWPVLGGVSVLCESIPPLWDITDASERLVQAMDLEGCSMVEFRRDPDGRPVLMEVNPRMGGSVALAISAGVNFPKLLHAWALDEPLAEITSYRIGQRLRWLAGDVWNLKSVFESQGQPDVPPRGRAAGRFLLDFVRPANTLDVIAVDDIRPALIEMNQLVLVHTWSRVRRASAIRWLAHSGAGR
jgi:predicted ATP-grasp superfamily ATP-dependent carboligase